jgi:hypothetical protein
MKTHEQAQQIANKLAARLGAGWRPHVNENLGFYASAELTDGLFVHFHESYGHPPSFSAFLGEEHPRYKGGGIWAESASTPEEAIEKVLAKAQAEVDMKSAAIRDARKVLEQSRMRSWQEKHEPKAERVTFTRPMGTVIHINIGIASASMTVDGDRHVMPLQHDEARRIIGHWEYEVLRDPAAYTLTREATDDDYWRIDGT